MNLPRSEQMHLWEGLWSGSFSLFDNVFEKLLSTSGGPLAWKRLPIRLYSRKEVNSAERIAVQRPLSLAGFPDDVSIGQLLELKETDRLIIQGIDVPLSTPVVWLLTNFTFADGFLHLLLVENIIVQ